MTRTIEFAERGAAFLDERLPGWRERIDPDTLELQDGCNCIIGQLLGSYYQGTKLLGLDAQYECVDLGFFVAPGRKWSTLTNAWRKVLRGA